MLCVVLWNSCVQFWNYGSLKVVPPFLSQPIYSQYEYSIVGQSTKWCCQKIAAVTERSNIAGWWPWSADLPVLPQIHSFQISGDGEHCSKPAPRPLLCHRIHTFMMLIYHFLAVSLLLLCYCIKLLRLICC